MTFDDEHLYIGTCCREWVLVHGARVGTCGICGEQPTYTRELTDGD